MHVNQDPRSSLQSAVEAASILIRSVIVAKRIHRSVQTMLFKAREQSCLSKVLIWLVLNYFSSSQHPDLNQLPPKSYQTITAHQFRPFTLTNTSPGEVKRIMKNLKTNKATGHDQIPARDVKESAEILCQPFSCLVNFSI